MHLVSFTFSGKDAVCCPVLFVHRVLVAHLGFTRVCACFRHVPCPKVSGSAEYVDDLPSPPGLLHAVLVTATKPKAFLRQLDTKPAFALNDDPKVGMCEPSGSGFSRGSQNCIEEATVSKWSSRFGLSTVLVLKSFLPRAWSCVACVHETGELRCRRRPGGRRDHRRRRALQPHRRREQGRAGAYHRHRIL